jgi:26S proteasome regulatory subunit T5
VRAQPDTEQRRCRAAAVQEKIKLNKQLPYLVANVVELLEMEPEDEPEEDGANIDLDAHRKGTCCVLKTSTRQTIFLPVPGLVEPANLKPADIVGVNKDSYLILEAMPSEFDSRVKAMEVDEKPTEEFNDVGGLDTQIQELIEAVVLPMTYAPPHKKTDAAITSPIQRRVSGTQPCRAASLGVRRLPARRGRWAPLPRERGRVGEPGCCCC